MVAASNGQQSPAYVAARKREDALLTGPFSHKPGILDVPTNAFMPYVSGMAGWASQGVDNMVRSATGKPIQIPAGVAGQAAEDAERAKIQNWEQSHPVSNIVGNLLALPLMGPPRVAADQATALRAAQAQRVQSQARPAQPAGAAPGRPAAAPSRPTPQPGLFGAKTAPYGVPGMVAASNGQQSPAYVAARKREDALLTGPFSHKPGILDVPTNAFMPYVSGMAGWASQGVDNMVRSATGKPIQIPAGVAGQAAEDAERAQIQNWEQSHPVSNIVGNVLALALMGPARGASVAAKAPGILGAVRRGANTVAGGAAIGGLYGAAEATPGHHLDGATGGAVLGGGLAAGGAAVAKGLSMAGNAAASAVSNRLGPQLEGAGADLSRVQSRRAANYVASKITAGGSSPADLATEALRARQARGARLTPAQAAQVAGKPVTAAETMGPTGLDALKATARRPGQTGGATQSYFGDRQDSMGDRIRGDILSITGHDPATAQNDVTAYVQKGQADTTPMFDVVRAHEGPVWSAELAAIAERPAMKKALAMTSEAMRNAGKDPTQMGLKIDPDTGGFVVNAPPKAGPGRKGKLPPLGEPVELEAGLEPQPTGEAWENVRQILGDLGKETDNMSNTQRIQAKGYQATQRDLTYELAGDGGAKQGLIPGYREALDSAQKYLKVEDAFKKTKGMLFGQGQGKNTIDVANHLASLETPEEQWAAQKAIAADIYDKTMANQANPQRWRPDAVKDKLTAAFGPDQANQISSRLEQERALQNAGRVAPPEAGSPTAGLTAEINAQDANPVADAAGNAAAAFISHGPAGVVGSVTGKIAKAVGSVVKGNGMPVPVRDEVGRLLMMSPDDLSAYYLKNALNPKPTPSLSTINPITVGGGILGGKLSGAMQPQGDGNQSLTLPVDPSLDPATYVGQFPTYQPPAQ
jgi:hypothetical protein